MIMCKRCLYCYEPLNDGEVDYHARCSRKIFGVSKAPELPYSRTELQGLAEQVIRSQTTLTGVQPKLSLDFDRMSRTPKRFTIVGLWGRYILKPQTDSYQALPELEDLTMHLAEIAGIEVVPHALIRFNDGELCYITRRIDRTNNGDKIAMEDMCQLTERLTEDKYKGSHERIAKAISQYSAVAKLDLTKYWEQVLFSWIVGNADMHLKNYSLYSPDGSDYQLTPAYDLLSTALVLPEDTEELALTLCGRKRKLTRQNFISAMKYAPISSKTLRR
jgi:serine/threonine-protein kinase HipA